MTPDASSVLGQVTWSEEVSSLFDLLKAHELPLLVKVHKGQYLNIGPGGLPSLGVHSTLLLTSGGRRRRLVAQGVKFKDSRRLVSVGQKLLIPDTFEGFFELLSEEGRSVRAIESVAELARLFPDSCIVRCNCKAYVSKSDSVETMTEPVKGTCWAMVNWASPVPGGISTTRMSSSPQRTSRSICCRADCTMRPRQIIGVSSGTRKPMDMHLIA